MPTTSYPIDFVAYDPAGAVVLLAEAKSRGGTSDLWAAEFRRNRLAHGMLPESKYFLIATPERIYGWKQESVSSSDALPNFTVDGRQTLAPYFARLKQNAKDIGPEAFEYLVLIWLTDIVRLAEGGGQLEPALKSLAELGLLSAMRRAQIEMTQAA